MTVLIWACVISLAAIVFKILITELEIPSKALPSSFRLNSTYDYIIGGGAAGCVLAGRLSEDRAALVLLLEAGPDDTGVETISIPGKAASNLRGEMDWGYHTVHQETTLKGLKKGSSLWPSGRVLGGSGSINGMQYVRGSRHDYDRWAKYLGTDQWDYRHVLPYFKKSEDVQITHLKHSEYHNKGGEIPVNQIKPQAIATKLLEAGENIGYTVNKDYNGKYMEGTSLSQVNSRNGRRWSTSNAFIHTLWNRDNLHVAVDSFVTKVIIENKLATGVEVIRNGRKQTFHVSKEVIVSAGAIGSPQLLMLSGVGPKRHLESLKIPVHVDLPVGENVQDHAQFDIGVKINHSLTVTNQHLNSFWGRLAHKIFGHAYQLETLAFKCTTKETRTQDWPDILIYFSSYLPSVEDLPHNYNEDVKEHMIERNDAGYGFMCLPTVLRPESRGKIALKSADPFELPVIEKNYLQEQEDVEAMIRGIQECEKFVNTQTLQEIGAELTEKSAARHCEGHRFKSHEYWQCLVKHRPVSAYHYSGSCKMGPERDPTAVVDAHFRVRGLQGLRVADASVMPWIVSGGTYAPTIMIAEKAADIIRGKPPLAPMNI